MNRLNALRRYWWNASEASTFDQLGFDHAMKECKLYGAIIDATRGRRSD